MLDKIQECFNRINAASVRVRAKAGDEALTVLAEELETLADTAEQIDVDTPEPEPAPAPPVDPVA